MQLNETTLSKKLEEYLGTLSPEEGYDHDPSPREVAAKHLNAFMGFVFPRLKQKAIVNDIFSKLNREQTDALDAYYNNPRAFRDEE